MRLTRLDNACGSQTPVPHPLTRPSVGDGSNHARGSPTPAARPRLWLTHACGSLTPAAYSRLRLTEARGTPSSPPVARGSVSGVRLGHDDLGLLDVVCVISAGTVGGAGPASCDSMNTTESLRKIMRAHM